ncbi:2-oxo-4-hydroxy-4-carboxy-5-ureidoimidazoline decarboxylase [Streptomyces sp. NA04227]|uniref:2-oxo-4-hydroxy-4-carboxy-5-ureidoimidazoline decarboxylase n=1 Tax=Streptomyces sp. NA04227 TaxID=2742136 RepID=UPI0015917668|nr:2-oxo-4-hydroxy-4-carboxy-5-ureidoimidazoline decarboxylase [Streptomyces sp. NA04227]QKW10067.1 2-oxo-4-hydroxy-4-carboxy-5-ureidoimidazoline decarboxylase [Streptomyces sp. NA04227]
MSSGSTPGLDRFNALPEERAETLLRNVCASRAWVHGLLARRPYASLGELLAASDEFTAALQARDLGEALAAHPPIGRPTAGDARSAREQRGAASASEQLRAELLALNLRYQERFGQVFLICATGLDGRTMRDALRTRLGNTPERERALVRTELGKINRIRLYELAEAQPKPQSALEPGAGSASEPKSRSASEAQGE